jgi:predicted metal-dependent peptidase
MTNEDKARKMLRQAVIKLSLEAPFLTAPGMSTEYIIDSGVKTAGTDGKSIRFNPDFIASMTLPQLVGLVAHENMHVGLGHPWRMGKRDHKLWNIACDCQINDMIGDMQYELPDDGVTYDAIVRTLVEAGCPPKRAATIRKESVEYTYALLDEFSKRSKKRKPQDKPGQDKPGQGKPCESDQGESNQGEESPVDKLPEPVAPVNKAPDSDNAQAKISEQIERLASGVETTEMIESKQPNIRGKVPGKLRSLLRKARENKVDWRSAVWKFVSGQTPADYTYTRTNKFYADDGIYVPVVERKGVGPIAVCVDTSGSVNDKMLSAFFAEVQGILDTVQPESIMVIPCDSEVHEAGISMLYPGDTYNNRKLGGGGGTCFKPPFQYLSRHDIHVDKVIYLTDMEGSFPPDPGIDTLWVSVAPRNTKAPFGDVVVVDIS